MENQLGKNIRRLREVNGETLEELGSKVFLSKTTISGYETGRRKPDFDKLVVIAKHFGKTVDELLHTDLTGIQASDINNKSVSDIIEIYRKIFPLFSSEETMRNSRFRSAYRLCEKALEASVKGENLSGHIVVDIWDCFLHAVDETEEPEAVANLVWSIFLWWSQINDIQRMLALQNKLQSNRIDMKGVIQEYQETQRTAEVSEKKQAFLQDFKEMITEAIKALKSDTEWAELGDYYLALTFLFDMVDTELSSEFNITIGNQMLVAYAELENTYALQFLATVFEF